jgi:hypothetical protein
LASSLTRNQVPGNRLGVRVPCPPLNIRTLCRKPLQNRGFLLCCLFGLQRGATCCARLLCRILRHYRLVVLSHLQVMLGGDGLAVANPRADKVNREPLGQLRFPRRTQVLKQLRPGLQAGPFDDAHQLSS